MAIMITRVCYDGQWRREECEEVKEIGDIDVLWKH